MHVSAQRREGATSLTRRRRGGRGEPQRVPGERGRAAALLSSMAGGAEGGSGGGTVKDDENSSSAVEDSLLPSSLQAAAAAATAAVTTAEAAAEAAVTSVTQPGRAHRGPAVKRSSRPGVRRTAGTSPPPSPPASNVNVNAVATTTNDRDFHGQRGRRVKRFIRHTAQNPEGPAAASRFPFEHGTFDFDGYAAGIPELTAAFTPLISADRLARPNPKP